jgi:DNA polymerase
MRATLLALNEELLRLKAAGVKTLPVSEESLRKLRDLARVSEAASTAPAASRQRDTSTGKVARPSFGESKPRPVAPAAAEDEALPTPPEVSLPEGDRQTRWDALFAQVQDDPVCRKSVRPGKKVVLGVGNLEATVFFCGEAPGAEEEVKGEPFVGPAGQLLTKMIVAMGVQRSEVYIGNIMNWRPQLPTREGREQVGNRPPTAEEMNYCLPYLRAQLEVVKPRVIVALGSTAARGLLGQDRFRTLGEVRGRWHEFAGTPVMVTYHPSYILRNQSIRSKRAIWEDLLQVMERVELPVTDRQRGFFLPK